MSTPRLTLVSARANLIAGVVVLLLAAGLGWSFLVGPATSDLAEARADFVDTTDANQLLAVRLQGLERQRDELASTVDKADDLAVAFPPTADQPGFFAMVDDAAAAAGIRPGQVTTLSPTAPLPAVAEDGTAVPEGTAEAPATAGSAALLAVQTVVVSVEAPYDALQRLLENLERMDRALLVQETLLSNDEGGTSVQITGQTYVAPPLLAPDVDAGAGSSGAQDGGTRAGGKP